ncbi:hypothetical protein J4E85_001465 [Alternaria conjuncta]|uniref:uncharacterized protein n=1 Tax=Alternaria conjuncta TaxID=181017 RepID=UPI00221E401F|nr:uncharacterized protein J4E85_001465 [Alternaria conjuncta]KAI4936137.1 hypothetical protein J4E85_001465 [Alternaria conjuncta]
MATTPSEQKRSSTGSRVLGMTGPAGEPGLPPSRPSSIATANSGSQNRWSQASPARRGGGMSVAGSLGHSRPTTSASRTHVPLAAHGFFRPMSSQRLQQQRNQRPNSLLGHGSLYSDATHETGSNPYRQSTGSTQTIRHGAPTLGLHHELDPQPPPSRGTDITDRDMPDRTTANTTPTGAETVRSRGESITPLQRPRPQHLDLSNVHGHDPGKLPTPSKSPRSFGSSFMLSSRDGRSAQIRPHQGHEKLTSAESSPRIARKEATKEAVKRELGRNYQYFSGNTAFCWGGRLQNTRDRPVNVATAILIILPAGLFFGFSYFREIYIHSPLLILMTIRSVSVRPPLSGPWWSPQPVRMQLWRCRRNIARVATSGDLHVLTIAVYVTIASRRKITIASGSTIAWDAATTVTSLSSCLFLLGASLAHILVWRAQTGASFGEAIDRWRVPFAMCIYGLLGWSYPFSLGIYHLFLVGRGETTREYLNSHKFLKKDRHRPFTQGSALKNWVAVLQRPRPPTYLHFKRKYEEGDQRFGSRKDKRTAPLVPEQQGGGVEMQDVSGSGAFQGPASRSGRDAADATVA